MRRYWWSGAALALAMTACPAAAQDDSGDRICLTVARIWIGTRDDLVRIPTTPVPDSFRRGFEAGGCTRFQLVLSSLTEWHLAFGDEASTTAALAYLAAGMVPDHDYSADLGELVAAAIKAAEVDPVTGKVTPKSAARLGELVGRGRVSIELAELYLRAAEFHGSSSLLARAEHYARPMLDARRPRGSGAESASKGTDAIMRQLEVHEGQADALEMHLAVVRARLTRRKADVAAAEAVVKAKENPQYRIAAEEAYENGDGFCEIGDRTDLADFAKACRDDGNFEWKAKAWIRERAQLDILNLSLSDDPTAARKLIWQDMASNLLRIIAIERAAQQEPLRSPVRPSDAEIEITLRLDRADALMRWAAIVPTDYHDGWGRAGLLRMAMDQAAAAEPIAAPSDTPGRFRQIATAYLAAYAGAVALEKGRPGATDLNYALADRRAAYFRTMLPLLKAIGEGRSPG